MLATTSIDTYLEIEQKGLINQLAMKVLSFIARNEDSPEFDGVISQADASRALDENDETCDAIRPRFVELIEHGVIAEVRKKLDPATGRKVQGYRLTGKMPVERPKRKTKNFRTLLKECAPHVPEALKADILNKLRVTSL